MRKTRFFFHQNKKKQKENVGIKKKDERKKIIIIFLHFYNANIFFHAIFIYLSHHIALRKAMGNGNVTKRRRGRRQDKTGKYKQFKMHDDEKGCFWYTFTTLCTDVRMLIMSTRIQTTHWETSGSTASTPCNYKQRGRSVAEAHYPIAELPMLLRLFLSSPFARMPYMQSWWGCQWHYGFAGTMRINIIYMFMKPNMWRLGCLVEGQNWVGVVIHSLYKYLYLDICAYVNNKEQQNNCTNS